MAYAIRDYRDGDAPALADLTLAAIRSIGSHGYSEKQVEAWAARHPGAQRFRARVEEGHRIFVAADADDCPVAYTLLEPDGHLDMLYCHPEHTRRGLANELLAQSEAYARGIAITRLYTEASELARPAFERAGYEVMHRRDFEIPYGDEAVPIHNYAMEKCLG